MHQKVEIADSDLKVGDEGLEFYFAGHQVDIRMSIDQMRWLAIGLALVADKRDGGATPPDVLLRLGVPQGSA